MHGKICYLEIPANSTADAASFYSSIFLAGRFASAGTGI
jgi:predicted enzyme related to lactoylglutathione lyase